jgi:hypothetical protein
MNKSVIAAAVLISLLAGCASTQEPVRVIDKKSALETKPDIGKAEATFLEKFGTVTIEFTEDGEWVRLKSTATSPLTFNHSNATEEAFMVATMRAKRGIAEFLNNEMRSEKIVKNISDVALKDIVNDNRANEDSVGSENRERANNIAVKVTERIQDNSNSILKGVYVSSRIIDRDSNRVSVEVSVSKKTINAAQMIRAKMGGL